MGLNVLSAIQGMSAIWDVRCWNVSLYKEACFLENSKILEKARAKFVKPWEMKYEKLSDIRWNRESYKVCHGDMFDWVEHVLTQDY